MNAVGNPTALRRTQSPATNALASQEAAMPPIQQIGGFCVGSPGPIAPGDSSSIFLRNMVKYEAESAEGGEARGLADAGAREKSALRRWKVRRGTHDSAPRRDLHHHGNCSAHRNRPSLLGGNA